MVNWGNGGNTRGKDDQLPSGMQCLKKKEYNNSIEIIYYEELSSNIKKWF
jgi:hypothetical protein